MWALIMLVCLGPTIMVIRNHLNLLTQPVVLVMVAAVLINSFLGQEWTEPHEDSASLTDFELAHSR